MTNNNAEIPELYTKVEDNELVINGMANFQFDTPYTVGFRPGKAASFSIKANELTNFDADTRIWLVDNLEGVEMDMTEGTTYNFISDKTTTETRFNLVFRAPSITTKLSDVNEKSIVVFQNAPNQITVNCKTILNENSKVVIYNHMGQKLITKQLTSNKMVIDLAFSAGVYIVAVYNANGKTTTNKIIIN
jgi:hypothetical protein